MEVWAVFSFTLKEGVGDRIFFYRGDILPLSFLKSICIIFQNWSSFSIWGPWKTLSAGYRRFLNPIPDICLKIGDILPQKLGPRRGKMWYSILPFLKMWYLILAFEIVIHVLGFWNCDRYTSFENVILHFSQYTIIIL